MLRTPIERPSRENLAAAHVSVRSYLGWLEAAYEELTLKASEAATKRGWEASRRHAERTGGWM